MSFNELLTTFANNLLPILLVSGAGFLLGKLLTVDSRSLGARGLLCVQSPACVRPDDEKYIEFATGAYDNRLYGFVHCRDGTARIPARKTVPSGEDHICWRSS